MHIFKRRRLTMFVFSLAILFYAVPRLPLVSEASLASSFSFVWLGFAFLVIAAHFRSVLDVDRDEAVRKAERLREARWRGERHRAAGTKEKAPLH